MDREASKMIAQKLVSHTSTHAYIHTHTRMHTDEGKQGRDREASQKIAQKLVSKLQNSVREVTMIKEILQDQQVWQTRTCLCVCVCAYAYEDAYLK
jgi:hypothetical protein